MTAMPPMAAYCVEAASPAAQQSRAIIDVAGPASVIDGILSRVQVPTLHVISDEVRDNQRQVSIGFGPAVDFRDLGGFIYSVQQAGLTMTSRFDPPICGMESK